MSEALSRRDRLREDAVSQIKAVARGQLVAAGPGGIHLRAIARDMGMTAPGLYRYFASLDDLIAALIVECFDEVIAAMEDARDRIAPDDLPGRLLAVSRVFRDWSVDHPPEFQLIFGAAPPGYSEAPEGPAEQAGARFGRVFQAIFAEIWLRRPFPAPDPGELDPALLGQLNDLRQRLDLPLPPGALYLFLACWVRVYGSVAMEVFGHLAWAVAEGQGLYETELRQLCALLGMAEEYRPPGLATSADRGPTSQPEAARNGQRS